MEKERRMLLLGGTNSAYEIKQYADAHNITLIATGKYPDTLLKRISAESYDVDAVDADGLVGLIKDKHIDAIFTGCNEDVIPFALEAAVRTGLPHYCDFEQWDICMNKAKFKELCINNGVPTAKRYDLDRLDEIPDYPVAVKPADSCGSQGFSVCKNAKEVITAAENAVKFSRTRTVIIEEYMPYDAVIIHYTLINGEVYFTGMSDKTSRRLGEGGSSVMALQLFPSRHIKSYMDSLNDKVVAMFKSIGMHDGAVWIEAFAEGGRFWFNEMGYRFGGSMTYHPVRYFYGVDQLELMIRYALDGCIKDVPEVAPQKVDKNYCILPLHVEACTIKEVIGEEEITSMPEVYAYVPIHGRGDTVKKTGTVSQVFCYLHVLYDDMDGLKATLKSILNKLKVLDAEGRNRLFCLTDIDAV